MSDRVKSNSMQDVFHAAGNSANINFGKYSPKDKPNPLGAREMSEAIQALISSNYNTGAYLVEYSDVEREIARNNIKAACKNIAVEINNYNTINSDCFNNDSFVELHRATKTVVQSGSGTPSSQNVRNFALANNVVIHVFGKNMWGGEQLVNYMRRYFDEVTVDAVNKTIQFHRSANINRAYDLAPAGIYEENTTYTFVLRGYNTSATANTTNLRCNYADGTNSATLKFDGTGTTKHSCIFNTASNKTLNAINRLIDAGQTVLYYDECGLFKGVVNSENLTANFEQSTGIDYVISLNTNVAGGIINFDSGVFTPYKYYSEYAGEEISGAWLSSIDEYVEGQQPSVGAEVVCLEEFDTPIEFAFDNKIPLNDENNNIYIEKTTINAATISVDTCKVVNEIYTEKLAELENKIAALDTRVTALENPPAQTTALNPENLTLVTNRPEILTPDVEPTEPTENM